MGAAYIDYIIADREVIPPEHEAFYTEKVVLSAGHLSGQRPAAADRRAHAERAPSSGCRNRGSCSARSTTITRSRRRCSMSGCGCWRRSRAACCGCWRTTRRRRAICGGRRRRAALRRSGWCLPRRVALDEHLARHRLADLFLDTLPYNAHTTASDALWAGLPVLTCRGTTFAGRVAASLLRAIGLPELITESLPAYEALALQLASDPALLAGIRDGSPATVTATRCSTPTASAATSRRPMSRCGSAVSAASRRRALPSRRSRNLG